MLGNFNKSRKHQKTPETHSENISRHNRNNIRNTLEITQKILQKKHEKYKRNTQETHIEIHQKTLENIWKTIKA